MVQNVQERPDRAGFRRNVGEQTQFLFTKEQFQAAFMGMNLTTAARALERAGMLRRNDRNLTVKATLPDLGKVRVYAVTMPDEDGGNHARHCSPTLQGKRRFGLHGTDRTDLETPVGPQEAGLAVVDPNRPD